MTLMKIHYFIQHSDFNHINPQLWEYFRFHNIISGRRSGFLEWSRIWIQLHIFGWNLGQWNVEICWPLSSYGVDKNQRRLFVSFSLEMAYLDISRQKIMQQKVNPLLRDFFSTRKFVRTDFGVVFKNIVNNRFSNWYDFQDFIYTKWNPV